MQDIRSLLGGMLSRHQITAQVTTARIIEVTNTRLTEILPLGRSGDAEAISVRDGVIFVRCLNASASAFVSEHAETILDTVKAKLPSAPVHGIRTRIGV